MRKFLSILGVGVFILILVACGNIASSESMHVSSDKRSDANSKDNMESTAMNSKMKITIGDYSFTVSLENNAAVNELVAMVKESPVVLELSDYAGFEKVGSLGTSLTRCDSQTTTVCGDIVLYNGDNIVMFYGSNSWSYTRLGKIEDLTNWTKALGSGKVTAIFSLE